MANMYGHMFPSLAHRLIYSYTIPSPEQPNPSCGISEEAQAQFHMFIKHLFEKLYEDPSVIGMPLYEDKLSGQEDKKTLQGARLKTEGKLNQFLDFLIKLGMVGESKGDTLLVKSSSVKLAARLKQLKALGFSVQEQEGLYVLSYAPFAQLFDAYCFHANRIQKKGIVARRVFSGGHTDWYAASAAERYGDFVASKNFICSVESFCQEQGFSCSNDPWDHRRILWEKEYPKKKRILFGIQVEPWRRFQVQYTLRASDFQAVFEAFDEMSEPLQQFIMDKANPCSGCRYCVQTDKSKTKPLAVSRVTLNGTSKAICSYYPFWSLQDMGDSMIKPVQELLATAERVLYAKYVKP